MSNQKKKNNKFEERPVSFKEMVEIRKQEMQSILPGFYTIVKDPNNGREEKVYSPDISSRFRYRIDGLDEVSEG